MADGSQLGESHVERLRALNLHHLRADISFSGRWREALHEAVRQGNQLDVPLCCALYVGANWRDELVGFVRELAEVRPDTGLWILQKADTTAATYDWIDEAREMLATYDSSIPCAAAAGPFFTELNRNPPPPNFANLLSFPFSPQAHLRDQRTAVENLRCVRETFTTTEIFSSQQIVLSPVTIRPFHNRPDQEEGAGTPSASVDRQQASLFAAAWTSGFLAQLSFPSRLHSVTMFETLGAGGVMEAETRTPLGHQGAEAFATVYPVYHVLADIAHHVRIGPAHSTHPLQVQAFKLLDRRNRPRMVLANLVCETQKVKVRTNLRGARIRRLHSENAEAAMHSPVEFNRAAGDLVMAVAGEIVMNLEPFEVARLDFI
jgi:hypothetical protein